MQINDYNFNTNCTVTAILHDQATPQELNIMKLSRRDGAKLISSNYAPKEIAIHGIIKGTSQSNLEANIDTFKKSVMVTNASLDIDYAGTYRRYTVDCSSATITRQNYNITFAPFEIKFIASNPPFAEEITALGGSLSIVEATTASAIVALLNDSVTFDGSAKPAPKITFVLDTVGNLAAIQVKNKTTGTEMDVTTAWADADLVEIDTNNMTVQRNLSDIEYEGVFPKFNLGSNDLQISITTTGTTRLQQFTDTPNGTEGIVVQFWLAQSFTPDATGNVNAIELLLNKSALDLTSDLTIRIETDNSNSPSGTLAHANGTITIAPEDVTTSLSWILKSLTAFSLSSGTKYWIVAYTTVYGGGSYGWGSKSSPGGSGYAGGQMVRSTDSGATWDTATYANQDLNFKIYYTDFTGSFDYKINYTKRYL